MPAANAPGFNAYHKWLGIPVSEQPPHFYRLLGIEPFEADSEVIAAGADRQMAHIKSFAAGQFADESQELLNELARARVTLLNPAQKAVYDRMLRQVLAAKKAAAPAPPPRKAEAVGVGGASRDFADAASVVPLNSSWRAPTRIARRRNNSTLQLVFILFALFGAAGLLGYAALTAPAVKDEQVSQVTPKVSEPSRPGVDRRSVEIREESLQRPTVEVRPLEPLEQAPPVAPPQVDAKSEPGEQKERKRREQKIEHIKLELENRVQRSKLDEKTYDEIQVTSLQGCDLPWVIKPVGGRIRENGNVRVEIAGTRKVTLAVTLDTGVQEQRLLVIEGEIETDDGKTLPFTLRNVERVRRQVLKQWEQATALLNSLTEEKDRRTAWLDSPTMKPAIQVGPTKDRVAELTKLIPQQTQHAESLRADLDVAEKICAMAEQLQKDCVLEIVSTEQEAVQPQAE